MNWAKGDACVAALARKAGMAAGRADRARARRPEIRDLQIVAEVAEQEWRIGNYDCFKREEAVQALERIAARKTLNFHKTVIRRRFRAVR